MTLAVITLGTSCLGIAIMLYIKTHEIKKGEYALFPNIRAAGDHVVRRMVHKGFRFFKIITNRKFWIALGRFLVQEFKDNVLGHEFVVKSVRKIDNTLQGRKTIKPQGKVSFYLQDVSEYKKDLQKGE